jgi:hypothetical protein
MLVGASEKPYKKPNLAEEFAPFTGILSEIAALAFDFNKSPAQCRSPSMFLNALRAFLGKLLFPRRISQP